jgi:acyl-CoA reductase-like NAD-dependent aldehyde dehydrogenase
VSDPFTSLSLEERLAHLAAWLDQWSDASSPTRKRLCRELPGPTGFHPATLEKGLSVAWDEFSGDDLRRCAERELGGGLAGDIAAGFPTTAVILAGALPMPSWQAMLLPILLGSALRVKPSRHDPISPTLFAEEVAELHPSFGRAVSILSATDRGAVARELAAADCVVAYGGDASIRELSQLVEPGQRFVGYGHRASFGVVGADASEPLERTAASLALDVALWDQLGCLSPVAVFAHDSVADPLADALAEQLAQAELRWPGGERDPSSSAAFADARNDAEFRAAAGGSVRLLAASAGAWVVTREEGTALRPSPLHRFIRIHTFSELADVCRALAPARRYLAALGIGGFGTGLPEARDALASLGASRICPLGKMQAPPFHWHHDNQPILLPLVRATDLEL